MNSTRSLALGAALLLAFAVPAAATTAIQLSDEDLVASADLIVVGTCTDVQSTWVERDLVTLATVEVRETLKGAPGATVTVVLPGGADTTGPVPVAVTWPGAPNLAPGADVFLFLSEYPAVAGGYAVAGFSQGLFAIVEGSGGEMKVTRDLSAMQLRGTKGDRRGGVRADGLEQFTRRVRSLVAGGEVSR